MGVAAVVFAHVLLLLQPEQSGHAVTLFPERLD